MILTKEEIELMRKLRTEQNKHRDLLITPSSDELKEMQAIAGRMNLSDYLALPKEKQRMWYINSGIIEPRLLGYLKEKQADIYLTAFYFEPWTPSILDRDY